MHVFCSEKRFSKDKGGSLRTFLLSSKIYILFFPFEIMRVKVTFFKRHAIREL